MTVDRQVATWFHDLASGSPALVRAGEIAAVALHPWVFRVAVALAVVLAWRSGRRHLALAAGVTMAVGGLLGWVLKLTVARPRPSWADPVAAEGGFSFPSLHAMNAALGVLLLLIRSWPWLREQEPVRRTALLAGSVVVLLAGLDRLVLGVHYLSDVLAGWALGALFAWAGLGVPGTAARRRLPAGSPP